MNRICLLLFCLMTLSFFLLSPPSHTAMAQESLDRISFRSARNLIIPQSGVIASNVQQQVNVTGVTVRVDIADAVATTTMYIDVHNPTTSLLEAEMLVPIPDGAVVRGFYFQGAAKEPQARVLPKDEARRTYEAIVAKIRDPALLEFVGYNLIQSSVFPVIAQGDQRVKLVYEHILQTEGNRMDYVLPRSELLSYRIPWDITVQIRSKTGIATTYSPSHETEMQRDSANRVKVTLHPAARTEPGSFLLSSLRATDAMNASLFAYPDGPDSGYFLLFAAVPSNPQADSALAIRREITLVLDRSGSMQGEKMDQARAAALQIVNGLRDGEAFNIIDYSDTVSKFANAPIEVTKESRETARAYLRRMQANGGTNIHDALIEALQQKPTQERLPLVLFLTDGLATVGVKNEVAIREAARKANTYHRRIFTFGVGFDVNAPLLSHLADKSRGIATTVLPNEDVEVKVSRVYQRLAGPVLADPTLVLATPDGAPTIRVSDMYPQALPDIFEGDQLVVMGRYQGTGSLQFHLNGKTLNADRKFAFDFSLASATTRNSFVPRLWASRKIAFLIDEIRQAGAAGLPANTRRANANHIDSNDPHMKELVDEIVRLSTEFGILTEYTAFLALKGTNLADMESNLRQAESNVIGRTWGDRSGISGANQQMNYSGQIEQSSENRRNGFWDANMNRVEITTVQQINDRAYYRRGNRWIDSRAIVAMNSAATNSDEAVATPQPDRTIEFGSEAYFELMSTVIQDNRQGLLSLQGEILLQLDGERVLITAAKTTDTKDDETTSSSNSPQRD